MTAASPEYPSRDEIIGMLVDTFYSGPVLNNAHRGDLVEMMVLAGLGQPKWRCVSKGWHPWDLETGSGRDRVRVQVKQTAAEQLWGPTKQRNLSFGWSDKPPSYFERDNPGVEIEPEGYFCDVFVFGIHESLENVPTDQVDPRQWRFLVIPAAEVPARTGSMVLRKALETWGPAVQWHELAGAVERAAARNRDFPADN